MRRRLAGLAHQRRGASAEPATKTKEAGEGERTVEPRAARTADGAAEHTVKPVPERPGRAWTKDGRYTEADIATLEAGDLTDSEVCAKLVVAYHRNDTATDAFPGFRRDLNVFVPEVALRAKLAALEAVAPRDARTRTLRMRILSALAMRAKRGIPPRWGWTYEVDDT